MRDRSNRLDAEEEMLPPWADCDLFCIQGYAGTVNSRCGWRGKMLEARFEEKTAKLLCPRCGSAMLIRIPQKE